MTERVEGEGLAKGGFGKIMRRVGATAFLLVIAVGVYHSHKPLPEGLSYQGQPRAARGVEFLADLTYVDSHSGSRETGSSERRVSAKHL
ncbi:MAG: hypothetical protein ACFHHU_08210 [Porticoccaceae bacterium]